MDPPPTSQQPRAPGATAVDGSWRVRALFVLLVLVWLCGSFAWVLTTRHGLNHDTAKYWEWSRHLALGYYTKPPLIAYIIAGVTALTGAQDHALKGVALLIHAGTLAVFFVFVRRITHSERAALLAVVFSMCMPESWLAPTLLLTDRPLAFFWVLAMYLFHRALAGERAMWAAAGAALGLAMLSKYTAALLVLAFFLYLLLRRRSVLRTAGPWLMLGCALCFLSGVAYWNWRHGWPSLLHTAGLNVPMAPGLAGRFTYLFRYLAEQALLIPGLPMGAALAWALWGLAHRARRNADACYLMCCFAPLFLFYAGVALTRPVYANWASPAYWALITVFAWLWAARPRPAFANAALALALALGCAQGVAYRMAYSPFTVGGRELGGMVSRGMEALDGAPVVLCEMDDLAAWSAFYGADHPRAYLLDFGDRERNQYDLWGGWEQAVGREALLVVHGGPEQLHRRIGQLVAAGLVDGGAHLETVEIPWRGETVRCFTVGRTTPLLRAPPAGAPIPSE